MRLTPGLAVAALAAAACTTKNPEYCEAPSECESGFTCDLDLHKCVAEPDAAAGIADASQGPDSSPTTDAAPDAGVPVDFLRTFGDTGFDSVDAVEIAPDGSILVGGRFTGTVDFGDGDVTSPGGQTALFFARYDSVTGGFIEQTTFQATNGATLVDLAVAPDGSFAAIGTFEGTLSFGGSDLVSSGTMTDLFVVVFNADGSHRWSKTVGGTSSETPGGVARDSTGNVYVGGSFFGSVNFGGGSKTNSGGGDGFLARYRGTDGVHQWSKQLTTDTASDSMLLNAIAVDAAGNVIATGQFEGTANLGGSGALTATALYDIFVAKYEGPNGGHLWSKQFGATLYNAGTAVVTDEDNAVVVVGVFTPPLNFGGAVLSPPTAESGFAVKFDTLGVHTWSIVAAGGNPKVAVNGDGDIAYASYGDAALYSAASGGVLTTWTASVNASDIAANTAALVIAGSFQNTVDFGVGSEMSAGGFDGFLLQTYGEMPVAP